MPRPAQGKTKEEPIVPTNPHAPPGMPVTDEALHAMQDEYLAAQSEHPKEEVKSGKERAQEIFESTQELNGAAKEKPQKKTKEEPKSKDEVEFDGDFPEFDSSQFIEGASENEEEEELEEFEPGEGEKEGEAEEESRSFSKETNIKNLRQLAGSFKKERDAALLAVEQYKKQVESQPDSQGLQSTIGQLKERVAELEQYELVFALHKNPGFKQKYVDAPNQIAEEMKAIATDYGVDGEVIDEILLTNNRRDLDEMLEQFFSSSSARGDLKTLKQRYNGILNERREYEQKPREALTQFHSSQEMDDAQVNQQRDKHLSTVMRDGWAAALQSAATVSKEKKIYELLEQPGKTDHNEKVVKPTLNDAQAMLNTGVDYIERLVRAKAVPNQQFIQWFAQICQQAAATQMVNHVRWGIHGKYQQLLKDQGQQRDYDRPGVASQKRTSAPKSKKPKGSSEIAAEIFSAVVSDK